MADSYDIVDIVYTSVSGAVSAGFTIYKDKSITGETANHIVINTTGTNTEYYVNSIPALNINIYIKRLSSGMNNRSLMKSTVHAIEAAIDNLQYDPGTYIDCKIEWIIPMDSDKEGFDLMNIRLKVLTELNIVKL